MHSASSSGNAEMSFSFLLWGGAWDCEFIPGARPHTWGSTRALYELRITPLGRLFFHFASTSAVPVPFVHTTPNSSSCHYWPRAGGTTAQSRFFVCADIRRQPYFRRGAAGGPGQRSPRATSKTEMNGKGTSVSLQLK